MLFQNFLGIDMELTYILDLIGVHIKEGLQEVFKLINRVGFNEVHELAAKGFDDVTI